MTHPFRRFIYSQYVFRHQHISQQFFRSIFSGNCSRTYSTGKGSDGDSVSGSGSNIINRPAIAFDIDGVLVRERHSIKGAKEALQKVTSVENGGTCKNGGLPYIFLTNGGGNVESYKAKQLETLFDIKVSPDIVCLSHTPMKSLVQKYKDSPVCVSGMYNVKDVALHYGFKHVFTPAELKHHNPALTPFCSNDLDTSSVSSLQSNSHSTALLQSLDNTPVGAIMLFHDPRDWYSDLQILLDILLDHHKRHPSPLRSHAHDGGAHTPAQIPVYFSNGDLQWSAQHHSPRLAQGAFHVCLGALYKEITGTDLQFTCFGKPQKVTYDYALSMLQRRARSMNVNISRVYGIGDNNFADIQGANGAGWESVFVKTGNIVVGEQRMQANPLLRPKHSFNDVLDAVSTIIKIHDPH
jgi:HAD superfamily hydrolase (TIGR01456 family)